MFICGCLLKVELVWVLLKLVDSCDCVLLEVLCFVVLCCCSIYDVVL